MFLFCVAATKKISFKIDAARPMQNHAYLYPTNAYDPYIGLLCVNFWSVLWLGFMANSDSRKFFCDLADCKTPKWLCFIRYATKLCEKLTNGQVYLNVKMILCIYEPFPLVEKIGVLLQNEV